MEIMQIEGMEGFHLIRFLKTGGELRQFRGVAEKVLNAIKL